MRFRSALPPALLLALLAGCTDPGGLVRAVTTAGASSAPVAPAARTSPLPHGTGTALPDAMRAVDVDPAQGGGTTTVTTAPSQTLVVVVAAPEAAGVKASTTRHPFHLSVSSFRPRSGAAEPAAVDDAGDAPPDTDGQGVLAGEAAAPFAPAVPAFQLAATHAVGDTDTFHVPVATVVGSQYHREDMPATLRWVGEHTYIWAVPQANVTDARAAELGRNFDTQIYPRDTATYGQEVATGPDGDPHVSILLTAHSGVAGMFDPTSMRPATAKNASTTNHRKLVFVDALAARSYEAALTHEFVHMIVYSQKNSRLKTVYEEPWIDEGLADYARNVTGFSVPTKASPVNSYLADPTSYALVSGYTDNPDLGHAYGMWFLFSNYMAGRFGEGVIKEELAAAHVGVAGLDDVGALHGTTFKEIYRDWTLANYVDGLGQAPDDRFHYTTLAVDGTVYPQNKANPGTVAHVKVTPVAKPEVDGAVRAWGCAYYKFSADAPQAWKVTLATADHHALLGTTFTGKGFDEP